MTILTIKRINHEGYKDIHNLLGYKNKSPVYGKTFVKNIGKKKDYNV